MSNIQTLQDPFLNILRKKHIPVFIFLVNGIKLQGHIESFDPYVVLLRNTVGQLQIIYKHSISTVFPTRNPHSSYNVFFAKLSDQNSFMEQNEHGSRYAQSRQNGYDHQSGFTEEILSEDILEDENNEQIR